MNNRIKAMVIGCLLLFIITDFDSDFNFFELNKAYGDTLTPLQTENTNTLPSDVFSPDPVTTNRMAPPPPEIIKEKWWKRALFKKKELPIEEEAIINVGPRAYPITRGPLFRLSQPLLVDSVEPSKASRSKQVETVLPPGFYLARYQKIGDHSQVMYLYHGRTLLAKIPLFSIANQKAEPVELIDEEAPPLESIQAVLIENGAKALITFVQGKSRYQSRPISVQLDPRPQLRY